MTNESNSDILAQIALLRVVPMIAIEDASDAPRLGDALAAGGLPCAEITFRTPAAAEAIRTLADRGDLLVGAGTVLTVDQADAAMDAGARFIVSPGTNPKVVAHVQDRGGVICPGVATPTDIELAMSFGLRTLKFFPAEANGGVKTLKAVSAPYAMVKFIPTGGVSLENLAGYLALPAVIAVGGSWVAKKEMIRDGKFEQIEQMAKESVEKALACV